MGDANTSFEEEITLGCCELQRMLSGLWGKYQWSEFRVNNLSRWLSKWTPPQC